MTTLSDNLADYRKQTPAVSSNGATKMRLIQEALSRARMRRPQSDYTPEAHRPARQVALEARHAATRELGGRRF
ncbi:hypothetical protein Abr02nite_03940 [Paractinoplanes brasiliensis]|nr:hypothetical protein Abr02nite_03940 [Actinoplanes brasiliensis]